GGFMGTSEIEDQNNAKKGAFWTTNLMTGKKITFTGHIKSILALVFFAFFGFCFCGCTNTNYDTSSPKDFAQSVLNIANTANQGSYYQQGMTSFSYNEKNKSAEIGYQFEPIQTGSNKEISFALCDQIK